MNEQNIIETINTIKNYVDSKTSTQTQMNELNSAVLAVKQYIDACNNGMLALQNPQFFVGKNLLKIRTSKNVTQAELAKILNVTTSTIKYIELDKKTVSLQQISRLSALFTVEPSYFVENSI